MVVLAKLRSPIHDLFLFCDVSGMCMSVLVALILNKILCVFGGNGWSFVLDCILLDEF